VQVPEGKGGRQVAWPKSRVLVTALPGGRVRVSFKAPWRSGTAHADMDAHQFLARLCALVPPPGFHMTRYNSVLAGHHRLREHVIPIPIPAAPWDLEGCAYLIARDASCVAGRRGACRGRGRGRAWRCARVRLRCARRGPVGCRSPI